MSKNKNRKRNADVAQNTGRITDRPKRKEFDTGHVEIQISGPKRFSREDDSVHIVAFKLNKYRNSVPLTTAELRELREEITNWLGDDYGPRPTAGEPIDVARIFDVPTDLIGP